MRRVKDTDTKSGDQLLERSLGRWFDDLRSGEAGVAGGSSAALATAVAAVLIATAARRSAGSWEEAPGAAAQAETLVARAVDLSSEDAEAFRQARDALEHRADLPADSRDETLRATLSYAADVPLRIAELAADVTVLAGEVAARGLPDSRADVVAGALLAAGAGRAAAHLVEVNLATASQDPRVERARVAAERAGEAAQRSAATTS
jgi:formiminotetrahydrofolate cyclodeaminase